MFEPPKDDDRLAAGTQDGGLVDGPQDANRLQARTAHSLPYEATPECDEPGLSLIVELVRRFFEAHGESSLGELARHANEAERVGDHVHAIHYAREALRRVVQLLDSPDAWVAASPGALPVPLGGGVRGARPQSTPNRMTDARYIFRLDGDYWTVGREDRVVRLKDSVGLRDLAQLLRCPGREFAAVDLAACRGRAQVIEGDVGEALDRRAKREFLQRVEELRDDLSEAERLGDIGRATCASAELERVLHELGRALGPGGRSRRAGSSADHARVNVTRTIRAAVQRIAEHDPWLGRHLGRTIRTGTYCSYTPDIDADVRWVFD